MPRRQRQPGELLEMRNKWDFVPRNANDEKKRKAEEEYETSLIEDLGEEFRRPHDILEQASLDTQITSSNVGFRLLQKMGWKGKGLGKNEQGIVEPIKGGTGDTKLGIGKQEQEDFYTAEENIQRKRLDIEFDYSEEHAKKREVIAERELKIQSDVEEIRKVFYCHLCSKQYKFAMEFEAHLSSYDHNHRKRFKDMKEMQGTTNRDDREKREQIRQEKEIAKFAQIVDAQKLQQQQEQVGEAGEAPNSSTLRSATSLADQDTRTTLKFGFSSKAATSKKSSTGAAKKAKIPIKIASVFGDDSDEDK